MTTITIDRKVRTIDFSKGFDIIRGKTVVDHAATYEMARRKAAQYRGSYIRYWVEKES